MTYQRCFSSLGCPELSLPEVLALAETHGISHVELRTLGGSVDLPAYFTEHYGTTDRLAAFLRGQPVRIVALNASLHLAGSTEPERQQLAALVPWAQAAGARWLRVFDGGRTAGAAEIADAADTLRWWRGTVPAGTGSADLMIETHDSLLGGDAIRRFLEVLPGASLLWDAHHTWRKGGEDPVATWRAIRDRVVHVHVKDSIPVASARHPFTYVLPGDGGFPMAELRRVLAADGYSGRVSLEWERQWHPYLPPLAEALRVAAERGWW